MNRYQPGRYRLTFSDGQTLIVMVANEVAAQRFPQTLATMSGLVSIARMQGDAMPQIRSTIEPAPGGDGPFMVVTRAASGVTNATLGVANIGAALDQAKTDAAAVLSGAPVTIVEIFTSY